MKCTDSFIRMLLHLYDALFIHEITCKKITAHLYFLHKFANFLIGRLFEFHKFGLFNELLLHFHELALKFLQSLPALLTEPKARWSVSV